jgi:hypothetical protein
VVQSDGGSERLGTSIVPLSLSPPPFLPSSRRLTLPLRPLRTKQNTDRVRLFRAAAAKHIKLAGEAADGRGVDRHLFGLKKLLKDGEELPALYQDPTFAQSGNWVLSTSQLSSEYFSNWGYCEGASFSLPFFNLFLD